MGPRVSLRATTRNPVVAWHWIPDVETPDLIRGRDDIWLLSLRATTRNPVVAWHWIPDQVRDDKTGHGMTNQAAGMTNRASGNDKVERAQPR